MPQWKYVVTLALLIYCVGVIFFALYPTDDVNWAEWVAVGITIIAVIGLIAYAVPGVEVPYQEYAYLVVGYAGFTALLLYLVDTMDSSQRRAAIALFLLSGAIAGYGAFLAQGQRQGP